MSLDKALRILKKADSGAFSFKSEGSVRVIGFAEIYYFEIEKNDVTLASVEGTYHFYGNLSEIERKLDPALFIERARIRSSPRSPIFGKRTSPSLRVTDSLAFAPAVGVRKL